MITLNVFFKVNPQKKSEFLKELTHMVTESNKESGCEFYQLWQDHDNHDFYVLIEHWKDKESLGGHQKTAHWQHFDSVVNSYLTEPYDEHHYKEIEQ